MSKSIKGSFINSEWGNIMDTVFTFDTQYPAPFEDKWTRSSKRFDTLQEASKAMSEWMIVCFDNDLHVACRLVELREF
jgi:hypothetical protein